MEFYHSIITHYDAIFPLNQKQVEFIKCHLGDSLKGKKLIDIGCGTGSLALALADEGADVIGLDFDDAMIEKAKSKNQGKIAQFYHADMRHMSNVNLDGGFDSVICFGNTLVHLTDILEIENFLAHVYGRLKSGGKLIIQIINYDRILDHGIGGLPTIRSDKFEFVRNYRRREGDGLIDFVTRLNFLDGRSVTNSVPLMPLRRKRLLELLDKVGFIDERFYGGFDGSDLLETSIPLVIACLKR